MKHLDIITCEYLGPDWQRLIGQGYDTAVIIKPEQVAVMWRGFAARDYLRNVQGVEAPCLR